MQARFDEQLPIGDTKPEPVSFDGSPMSSILYGRAIAAHPHSV